MNQFLSGFIEAPVSLLTVPSANLSAHPICTSLSHDDSHTTFGRSLQTHKKRYTLPLQGIAYLPSTHIDRNSVRLKALGAGTGFVPVILRNYTMRSFIRQL